MGVATTKDVKVKVKRKSQRDKILDMLRVAGENGVTNTKFQSVSIRWDARIRELYQEGYGIRVEPTKEDGVYRYTLIEEPTEKVEKPKRAMEVLISEIQTNHDGVITADDLARLVKEKNFNVVRAFGYHKKA